MKRILLFAALLSVCIFASAKEASQHNTKDNRALENSRKFSHWSISLGGGANLMIGDKNAFNKLSIGENLGKRMNWGIDFQCEYMINPMWGVMFQYMYTPQNKKSLNYLDEKFNMHPSIHTDKDLQMHEFNLQFVFNVLNIFDRSRYRTDWNFFMGVGIGLLDFEKYDETRHVFGRAFTIPAFMSVEYTPIPSIGVFAETQFRWYNKDDINIVHYDFMQDMSLYGGLGIRYHILANKKPHVHNINVDTYKPIRGISQSGTDKDERIEEMQSKIDFLTEQMNKVNTNIANLEKGQGGKIQGTDSATMQKVDDLESTINELKNKYGDNIYRTENNIYQYNSEDNSIYFDYKSSSIKSIYYKDIMKIAQRMLNDYKLKLKVTGYCDAQGSDEYNRELAQKRIDAIIYVLVNRYRVARDRFITENAGKTSSENEVDELSRRVDIEYFY